MLCQCQLKAIAPTICLLETIGLHVLAKYYISPVSVDILALSFSYAIALIASYNSQLGLCLPLCVYWCVNLNHLSQFEDKLFPLISTVIVNL